MDSSNKYRIYELKISQLQAAFKKNLDEPYFEEIIKSDFDINHEIFEYDSKNKYFKSLTALHLAFDHKKIKVFNLFLRYGADILKHDNDCTVLQKAIQEGYEEKKNSLKASVLPFIQSVLTVHIDTKIQGNPANKHGISHFHVACATNHIEAVEFFLSVDVSVNQTINSDSPVLPGYTCLHLAVQYYALETVQLLLKYNANLNLKEKNGLTPLQLIVHKKLELNDFINNGKTIVNEAIMKELEVSDKILCLLLDHKPEDSFYPYAVCTLKDSSLVKKLLEPIANLDHPVDSNSPWWPGYTMLHFAACCNVNTVLHLLDRGASMEVKDARGHTPFDLCLTRYNVEIIHILIAYYPSWNNINLSDSKTKLRDVVFAMSDANEFKALLQNIETNINELQVPDFSMLWPGSTLLHLAVYFTKHNRLALIEECLNKGADVTVKDKRGWTPIHLAFRQYKIRATKLLLQHQKSEDNPTDDDNLSHLHVACAVKNEALVAKLIGGADLELAYKGGWLSNLVKQGATPIHVAVASGSCEIVEMLLRNGADLYAKDGSGLTPIHRVLVGKNVKALGMVLLSQPNLKDSLIEAIGLNYLHVASYVGHVDAVRRLLELGVDIDGRVCCILPQTRFFKFEGFSPLHFAVENNCKEVAQMLLECGADILVKKDENSALFYEILSSYNVDFYDMFVSTLKTNFVFQKRLLKDCKMTMLHVACHALDFDFAKHLLDIGLNVDAQIKERSKIWPGCTPLHVLAKRDPVYFVTVEAENKIDRMMKLLLNGGADVTIVNEDGKTPVHLFFESFEYDNPAEGIENYNRLRQLLEAQKDFKVNPSNIEGISHFHIACLINEASIVKNFLENGIDVNESIDSCSSHVFAGCTGLHLSSLSYVGLFNDFQLQRDTVDVLLKYGAEVRARDSCENTPLHSAAECELVHDAELFDKLIRAGADITAENIRKETPFECLLRSDSATLDVVDFFIKSGYRLNTFKPITEEGVVGQICCCSVGVSVSEIIERAPEVVQIDEMGRTLIHNIVSFALEEDALSSLYSGIIEKLIQLGCDIDAKDRFGKTALHYAVKFHNSQAVFELLDNGADVNVADLDGSSAFAYSLRSCEMCVDSEHFLLLRRNIIAMFAKHVMKLRECGLYESRYNQSVKIEALRLIGNELTIEQTFYDELDEAKCVKVGLSSFVVHDFLSETGAVAAYPSTPHLERVEINKFFESLDDRFQETKCLLKLQHKKALMRWKLNVDATRALRILLKSSLPELCCWMIFRFLGKSDLTNLIETMVEVESEDTKMCVD